MTDGCYDALDLTGYITTTVSEDVSTTCKQQCLGSDSSYSILHDGNRCTCVNSTLVRTASTTEQSLEQCSNTSANSVYRVIDTGKAAFIYEEKNNKNNIKHGVVHQLYNYVELRVT